MKTALYIVLVSAALSYGYYYIADNKAVHENFINESQVQDSVAEMKLIPPLNISESGQNDKKIADFIDETLGFSFKYRTVPDGYSVILHSAAGSSYSNLLAFYRVMKTSDYNQMLQDVTRGIYYGSPVSINIQVYDADSTTDVKNWLVENSTSTNCEVDTIVPGTIDGSVAASCQWSGLYDGITTAFLSNKKVYMLTGDRDLFETENGHSNNTDFNELVSSFRVF